MKMFCVISLLLVFGTTTAKAQSFAYVPNLSSTSVSVINTASVTAVSTVGIGARTYGVAVSPDGTRVYVASTSLSGPFSPGFVSIISTATNSVVSTVEVGDNPT